MKETVSMDDPLPTRASLLERIRNSSDVDSWNEFYRIYRGLLLGVTRLAGLNDADAQEVAQEALIAVAKRMPNFCYEPGRDSFKGWLLQILRWKLNDHFRRQALDNRKQDRFTDAAALAESAPSDFKLEEIWDREWQEHILHQALAIVRRNSNPQHYAIYHLHVIEQKPVSAVRQAFGVNTTQVYLAKHRIGRQLRSVLKRLENSP